MSGSIVDEPTPVRSLEGAEPVELSQLADMLFLVFEAVKDLEASFEGLRRELKDES